MITRDIIGTLERKIGYVLSEDIKSRIQSLEEQFIDEFWRYVPDKVQKLAIRSNVIAAGIQQVADDARTIPVSLDRIYAPDANLFLEITRRTNPFTGAITLAERPGTPPLQEQIQRLREYSPLHLIDVGAFSGSSLLELSVCLEQAGIKVQRITLGVANCTAINRLSEKVKEVQSAYTFRFYEWIELRDLLGIDGRAINNGRDKTFIPYWENLAEWASIASEYEQSVREVCLRYNARLTRLLDVAGFPIEKIGTRVRYLGRKK